MFMCFALSTVSGQTVCAVLSQEEIQKVADRWEKIQVDSMTIAPVSTAIQNDIFKNLAFTIELFVHAKTQVVLALFLLCLTSFDDQQWNLVWQTLLKSIRALDIWYNRLEESIPNLICSSADLLLYRFLTERVFLVVNIIMGSTDQKSINENLHTLLLAIPLNNKYGKNIKEYHTKFFVHANKKRLTYELNHALDARIVIPEKLVPLLELPEYAQLKNFFQTAQSDSHELKIDTLYQYLFSNFSEKF